MITACGRPGTIALPRFSKEDTRRPEAEWERIEGALDVVPLAAPGFGIVAAWRKEQEHALRDAFDDQAKPGADAR